MTQERQPLRFTRSNPRRVPVLALAGALVGASALAGWVVYIPQRTWTQRPDYVVDNRGLSSISDSDGGVTRTVLAVRAWNGIGRYLIDSHAGSVAGFSLNDGIPMINFTDPFVDCTGNCLAATYISRYSQRSNGTWEIDDADIVTNTGHAWTSTAESGGCSNEFYVEGVMTHEAGHGLGIAHSGVSGATMYPTTLPCDNSGASLASDDVNAARCLYHDLDGDGSTFASRRIASLHWIGGCYPSGSVDVFRNGTRIKTTGDGGGTSDITYGVGGSANYWICDAGSTPYYDGTTCSNVVTVSFN